ncbi:class I SAM-dependent methyltransferase [Thermodesulfobacteriota bacterium]
MGLIFDIHSARLYEAWYQSSRGQMIDLFIKDHLRDLLSPLQGERILDIGCGSGNHLLSMSRMGLDLNGVDASPYMLDLARKRLGDRCLLRKGMAEDLPFEDNEFDITTMINTLEFLDDPLQVLREAGRVTRRKIFIGTINSLSWFYLWDKLQGIFRDNLFNQLRAYSLWDLKSYVGRVFGPVSVEWKSARTWPFSAEIFHSASKDFFGLDHWPISPFLGISTTMAYTMKTDKLPLKVGISKTGESVMQG